MSTTTFNFAASASRLTTDARNKARIERDYAGMVEHYNFDYSTPSDAFTAAAVEIVMTAIERAGKAVTETEVRGAVKGTRDGQQWALTGDALAYNKARRAIAQSLTRRAKKINAPENTESAALLTRRGEASSLDAVIAAWYAANPAASAA